MKLEDLGKDGKIDTNNPHFKFLRTKLCAWCGKKIPMLSNLKKFCSIECRKARNNAKKKEAKKRSSGLRDEGDGL